ncbi:MAG: flagellar hook protein [Butyrivibrio sp.]|nr:flagellar hook protein [Butyrivibrio sp.]
MVVQHNVTAMNSNRMLGVTTSSQAKSAEKLSSGYRVNRAADDAAGLSISEKMRKQIRGLDQASTNAQDGVSSVQTAEGALTEVHDMLQRMNELAVQAANGTNSESDRNSIQDEINQLTTEIDRVAETTKFNETYLLKGASGTRNKYMAAKDAGLQGTLADSTTKATFEMRLQANTDVKIAGKEYHIYDDAKDKISTIQQSIAGSGANSIGGLGSVTINGNKFVKAKSSDSTRTDQVWKLGDEEFTTAEIQARVVDGAKVQAGTSGNYATARVAVDNTLDKNILVGSSGPKGQTSARAKVQAALEQANRIGVDSNKQTSVSVTSGTQASGAGNNIYRFSITKQYATVAKDLGLALHVGADADNTNKIMVNIEAMTSKNLGVQGLNVADTTGNAATYAIDAIEGAIKQVSAQRSALGAVQNRLEHTIKNVDNVVENTTAAESRIRDTDMASEMVTYSKNNILAQAGQSMLAQANQSNQGVLSLLG